MLGKANVASDPSPLAGTALKLPFMGTPAWGTVRSELPPPVEATLLEPPPAAKAPNTATRPNKAIRPITTYGLTFGILLSSLDLWRWTVWGGNRWDYRGPSAVEDDSPPHCWE